MKQHIDGCRGITHHVPCDCTELLDTRSWNDQPAEVSAAARLCSFSMEGVQIEIRHSTTTPWYVTAGNLFGSQTLRCEGAECALRAVEALKLRHRDRPVQLPPGCVLLSEPS
jgi:hypothetical protein